MTSRDENDDEAEGAGRPRESADRRYRLERARRRLRRSLARLTDSELLDAMRRREPAAIEAFVDRFHAIVLNYARRSGFAEEECDELVVEFLSDVVLDLVTPGRTPPVNVRRYMIGAFRHRCFKYERTEVRRERRVREGATELAHERDELGRRSSAAGLSQHAIRQANGPGDEPAGMSPVLYRLSSMLHDGLSADERSMLDWVSEGLPQRVVAEWMGLDYAVARQRLARLRRRLAEAVYEYGDRLPPDEQRQLREFLRRCGALPDGGRDAAG